MWSRKRRGVASLDLEDLCSQGAKSTAEKFRQPVALKKAPSGG
jgi:hypothetical protein